jgi:hypothetical protein
MPDLQTRLFFGGHLEAKHLIFASGVERIKIDNLSLARTVALRSNHVASVIVNTDHRRVRSRAFIRGDFVQDKLC